MTLCIGARCHYGGYPRIVLCFDEQAGTDSETFDGVLKCDYLCEGFAALFSGPTGAAKELMRRYKAELSATQLRPDTIISQLSDVYGSWRKAELDRASRHSLGMSFKQAIRTNQSDVTKAIAGTVQVIVAGFINGESIIITIDEESAREVDHCAVIGTGWQGAEAILSFRKYTSNVDLDHALYLVYEAKRFGEISPHVGKSVTLLRVLEPKEECAFRQRIVPIEGIEFLKIQFEQEYGPRSVPASFSVPPEYIL
jgi:hypothetical protein